MYSNARNLQQYLLCFEVKCVNILTKSDENISYGIIPAMFSISFKTLDSTWF